MRLNEYGEIVRTEWLQTAVVRPYVVLHPDELVVMPNHVHGIIWIVDANAVGATRVGATRRVAPTTSPPRGPEAGSIGAIIGQFKSITAKRINALRDAPGAPVWQRDYYEHIIRDETSLRRIRAYIAANPQQWTLDGENPASPATGDAAS
jgi:REP element-mobilizing transposase RayT